MTDFQRGGFCCLALVVYFGGAVLAGRTAFDARLRYTGKEEITASIIVGAVWPVMSVFLGVVLMMTGDAGIFDKSQKGTPP